MKTKTLALISQDIRQSGGIKSVTQFAYNCAKSYGIEPTILSYAPFKTDSNLSVSTLNPFGSWRVQSKDIDYEQYRIKLIGAYFPEYEPNRYKSNETWKEVTSHFDMHLVIGGSAINGFAIESIAKKYLTWTATSIFDDRKDRLNQQSAIYPYQMRNLKQLQQMENRVMKNASMHLFQSNYAKESHDRSGTHHVKFKYLPIGIDVEFFKPLLGKSKNYILFVGRFNDERKNINLLLHAYRISKNELQSKMPKLKLAGALPSERILNLVKSLDLVNDVEFEGIVPLSELPKLYQEALMFVLPSIQEGLGIVLLEAMASGVPVISTRCGGPETIINHDENGFFCENNSPEDMAEKMVRLLTNHELQGIFATKGRERVVSFFSTAAVGENLINSLKEVYTELFQFD